MKPSERIILALDTVLESKAKELVEATSGKVGYYRLTWPLLALHGVKILDRFVDPVFLDLRLSDDVTVVKKLMQPFSSLPKVHFLSVSPFIGKTALTEVIKSAAPGADVVMCTPSIVLNKNDLDVLRCTGKALEETTLRIVRHAYNLGLSVVQCTPHELGFLRDELPKGIDLICDEIKGIGGQLGTEDPSTPFGAIMAGANYVVAGSVITQHYAVPSMAAAVAANIEAAIQEKFKETSKPTAAAKPKLKVSVLRQGGEVIPPERSLTIVPKAEAEPLVADHLKLLPVPASQGRSRRLINNPDRDHLKTYTQADIDEMMAQVDQTAISSTKKTSTSKMVDPLLSADQQGLPTSVSPD